MYQLQSTGCLQTLRLSSDLANHRTMSGNKRGQKWREHFQHCYIIMLCILDSKDRHSETCFNLKIICLNF